MAPFEYFGWVMRNCKGLPPESVYQDKWLQEEDRSEAFGPVMVLTPVIMVIVTEVLSMITGLKGVFKDG